MKKISQTPTREFSKEFFSKLKESILATKKILSPPYYAAFDADGTLWNMDMGESFFEYQIKNCGLENLPSDPEAYYLELKDQGRFEEAYLWLAQINQNRSVRQVREWASEFFQQLPELPLFKSQKQLISFLQEEDITVYVVTASIKWSVEPGAAIFGIPEEHVLGVKTQLRPGPQAELIISDQADGAITYKAGKALAILEATQGVAPVFACGNTTGDTQLLESSQGVCLAVASQPPGTDLFESEEGLRQKAIEKNWFTHAFWT
jgi:phosphoserine phosphatase